MQYKCSICVCVIYPHVQCRDIFPLDLTQLSGLLCLELFPACLVPQGGLRKVLSTSPLGLLRRSCTALAAPGRGRGDQSSSCPPLLTAPGLVKLQLCSFEEFDVLENFVFFVNPRVSLTWHLGWLRSCQEQPRRSVGNRCQAGICDFSTGILCSSPQK